MGENVSWPLSHNIVKSQFQVNCTSKYKKKKKLSSMQYLDVKVWQLLLKQEKKPLNIKEKSHWYTEFY